MRGSYGKGGGGGGGKGGKAGSGGKGGSWSAPFPFSGKVVKLTRQGDYNYCFVQCDLSHMQVYVPSAAFQNKGDFWCVLEGAHINGQCQKRDFYPNAKACSAHLGQPKLAGPNTSGPNGPEPNGRII